MFRRLHALLYFLILSVVAEIPEVSSGKYGSGNLLEDDMNTRNFRVSSNENMNKDM